MVLQVVLADIVGDLDFQEADLGPRPRRPRRLRRRQMASSRTCSEPGVVHGSLAGALRAEADRLTTTTTTTTTATSRTSRTG